MSWYSKSIVITWLLCEIPSIPGTISPVFINSLELEFSLQGKGSLSWIETEYDDDDGNGDGDDDIVALANVMQSGC